MDELAFSLNGENVHYGTPRNPACPDRIPGGSSSGSAVSETLHKPDCHHPVGYWRKEPAAYAKSYCPGQGRHVRGQQPHTAEASTVRHVTFCAQVAVADGTVDFAMGSDTGGSVRVPASFCGILGLRPTWSRVSLKGACTLAETSSIEPST